MRSHLEFAFSASNVFMGLEIKSQSPCLIHIINRTKMQDVMSHCSLIGQENLKQEDVCCPGKRVTRE